MDKPIEAITRSNIQACYPFTAQRGLLGFPALRHFFIFNTRHSQPSQLDMAAGSRAWRGKPFTMQKVKAQVVQQSSTPTCPNSAHWRSLRRTAACAYEMFQTWRHLWDTPRNIQYVFRIAHVLPPEILDEVCALNEGSASSNWFRSQDLTSHHPRSPILCMLIT